MTILVLSQLQNATGNATTARRIALHLRFLGHTVVLLNTQTASDAMLADLVKREGIDAAVGMHALGSGKFLRKTPLPYAIVFGGTDLNEYVHDEKAMAVITEAVMRARALVVFDEDFQARVRHYWPTCTEKTHVVAQGTQTSPSSFSLRKTLHMKSAETLILLPSGLRPVKDPLFCARELSALHRCRPGVRTVIVGAVRDEHFAEAMLKDIASLPRVEFFGTLPQADLHAAMREADVVLNTSQSESCPNAILEAMQLGTPVVVRDIPGNRSIVEHEKTGLLFSTPDECIQCTLHLLEQPSLRQRLVKAAQSDIRVGHDLEHERAGYARVVETLEGELRAD